MQKQYFDATFWKTVTWFFVIVFAVIGLILVLNYYNNKMYGPDELKELQRIKDQTANQQ